MTAPIVSEESGPARVLVLSMFFSPCREVGGKRFSYLSQYLARRFAEYHVLARRERNVREDQSAFNGRVHRTGMFPYFPSRHRDGIWRKLSRLWAQWLCQVDPYIGWVIPATFKGIGLCRRHSLNVVVVTVPAFSSTMAAILISRVTGCKLVLDYRDEWTNHVARKYRRPFGIYCSRALEKAAIRQASAVVLCTEIMHKDFLASFGEIAPPHLEVIYNGYEDHNHAAKTPPRGAEIDMVYAGNFYGKRQLSIIAPALAELLNLGVISAESFRLHLFSNLKSADRELIERSDIADIVEVHEPVPYHSMQGILRSCDILFLPSGDEFNYALPFKFFDYLSARRPILAVASKESTVYQLMKTVDCGAFAEIGHQEQIVEAIKTLLQSGKEFTFRGAERFKWSNAAAQYFELTNRIVPPRYPGE